MSSKKKYNSINDQAAQQLRNSQNSIELLTKIDQALNSNESHVSIKTVDSNGKEVISQMVTIGFFQQKLDQIYKMVKVLSGVEGAGASLQLANNTFKRIITADLNGEPKPISQLSSISTFNTDPNWIFDAFLNPKISVSLDLTGKIDDVTKTVRSKRFIVKFEKIALYDVNGNATTQLSVDAQTRLSEFDIKYKGKADINMVEFVSWLDSPGLINNSNDFLISDNNFRVEPNRLQHKGVFSVLSTDIDTINKKLWFILDTLTYYDVSDPLSAPNPVTLKVGDKVAVKPINTSSKSSTIYTVAEINTITSQYKVRFEQVFGEEPIQVRLNAIEIYSETVKARTVKVNVGFDEHSVVFVKAVDDVNNITGLDWSQGIGFYTNELRLDSSTGELFSDYYVSQVYDYGLVLEDLVQKKIPNHYAVIPDAPTLNVNNFKVVQINSHLTQTVEAEEIRDLHNTKNNLASQISQIHETIEKQNRLISTTTFNSAADKKRANDELVTLNTKLQTKSATKTTIISDILARKKNLNKIPAIFHVRGFFAMPTAKESTQSNPQEVVQFEIWYRKLSKSGDENPILTISDLSNLSAQQTALTNSNTITPKTVNATFSNWIKLKTDSRKREQDPISKIWTWKIEDVSDANTPNINQIDIPLLPGEKIQIKVKSLSEVGWPEAPIESEFSEPIEIVFPDDLNNVVNEDQFILKEAQADDIKVTFQKELESKGLTLHLSSALRDSDIYYAHKAEAIASGIVDGNGKMINLYDQLLNMINKINTLEETITRAKGILEVYLINRGNKTKLFNGNNLSFNINLEDYMTRTKIGLASAPVDSIARTYKNEVMLINDFSLQVFNAAASANLGLLSYRGYGSPSGKQDARFAYNFKSVISGSIAQPVWIQSDSTVLTTELPLNTATPYYLAPRYGTQTDNQWIWLHSGDITGKEIYAIDASQPSNNVWSGTSSITNGASTMHNVLIDIEKNVGFKTADQTLGASANPITTITDQLNWQKNELPTTITSEIGRMGSTIHPVIGAFTEISDTSSQLIKIIKAGDLDSITIPLNIYAKPYTGTGVAQSYNTGGGQINDANLQFGDSSYSDGSTATANMPEIDNIGWTITTTTVGIPLLYLSGRVIQIGDRIIINNITGILTELNNVLVTVKAIGTGLVTVSFNNSGAAKTADGGAKIVQLHKHYNDGTTTTGRELHAYNVLGKVTTDDRYVNNYIEIVGATSPAPTKHTKKLRFFMEDENNIRPFEFQFTFNITQYKATVLSQNNYQQQQQVIV